MARPVARLRFLVVLALAAGCAHPSPPLEWRKLDTVPYAHKQDDIVFATPKVGWYGNGAGKLYRTDDGGQTWREQWSRPGTYIRALGFVDEEVGVLGNVGPGWFPAGTDPQPLYRTEDGGATWSAVTAVKGPSVTGICAIDVLKQRGTGGSAAYGETTIFAGGRVGGPAFLMRSDDSGKTWRSQDMNGQTAMILDVKFLDENTGFIAGATEAQPENTHPLVLKTADGGATWTPVYRGSRPREITWKIAFPSRRVGYVTIQSYDPQNPRRFIAKTEDGGDTWVELPIIEDSTWQAFGVGFVDERRGWVGGSYTGLETQDGGRSWKPVSMGESVNKIRVVTSAAGKSVFAIGKDVYRLDIPR